MYCFFFVRKAAVKQPHNNSKTFSLTASSAGPYIHTSYIHTYIHTYIGPLGTRQLHGCEAVTSLGYLLKVMRSLFS
jgi:hypothetical protein